MYVHILDAQEVMGMNHVILIASANVDISGGMNNLP
jgi:hypothetical protein